MTLALPKPTLQDLLAQLRERLAADFGIVNGDAFGVFDTYLELAAQGMTDARAFTIDLAPQGYPHLATGFWLDEHARSHGMQRIPASHAAGQVYFATLQGGTVPADTIVQTLPDATGDTLRYVVTTDTPIAAPGGLVPVRAETAGVSHNVGAGRISTLVTVLPFVTSVSNTPDWLTTAGVDRETDDQLQHRLLLRWPSLSRGGVRANYEFAALSIPGIVKVLVRDEHPRGQGTVDVVIAPRSGAPTAQQIADVEAALIAVRGVTANVLVTGPTLVPHDLHVTVTRRPGSTTDASVFQQRVQAAFDKLGIEDVLYPAVAATAVTQLETTDANGTTVYVTNPDVLGVVITTPLTPIDPGPGGLVVAGDITVTVV